MVEHICKHSAMKDGGRQAFVVDRPRKIVQIMCTGCGKKWDSEDGVREFRIWAEGYRAAKRDMGRAIDEVPTPDMVAWEGGEFEL